METKKSGMKQNSYRRQYRKREETNQLLRTKVQERVNKELRLKESPKEPKEKTMVLD